MSKTLANLRTGVRMYLDESAQTDWLDTEVLREVNYAYQELAGKVMEVYEEYYNTITAKTYSTVANQQEYTLDSTLLKIERVEINYAPTTTGSVAVRAQAIKYSELPLNLGNTTVGGTGLFASGYYVNGGPPTQKIGFVPIPTIAGTNSITVWGVEAPADLSSDTDSVYIPYVDRFAKLIEVKAAAELLRKGQQEEDIAKRYLQEYKLGIIEMQSFLKERQSDGPWMIEDTQYEDIGFDNPLSS